MDENLKYGGGSIFSLIFFGGQSLMSIYVRSGRQVDGFCYFYQDRKKDDEIKLYKDESWLSP